MVNVVVLLCAIFACAHAKEVAKSSKPGTSDSKSDKSKPPNGDSKSETGGSKPAPGGNSCTVLERLQSVNQDRVLTRAYSCYCTASVTLGKGYGSKVETQKKYQSLDVSDYTGVRIQRDTAVLTVTSRLMP